MTIAIRDFKGIAPAIVDRNLPDGAATVAVNCYLNDGGLHSFLGTSFTVTPTKAGRKTIYRFDQENENEAQYWFVWADDVDVIKAQVAGDTEERTIYAGDTAYNHPRVTTATLALTGGTDYPMSSHRLGVPAPSAAVDATVSGVGDGTTITRAIVFTYVNGTGEESQPSAPTEFDGKDGQTFTYNNFPAVPSGYDIVARRFYRAAVGESGEPVYLLVNQVDEPVANTSYEDTVLDVDLGEECPSIDWAEPPAGLVGLVNLPNGMVAGWDVNKPYELRLCEPYRPFAWPEDYVKPVDFPIIGLGVFGEYVAVFTQGKTYIGIGTDPQAFMLRGSDFQEVCASKRSIAATRTGLFFVSYRGICRLGAGNSGLLTETIIDRDYWETLNPSSMYGYHYDGRYIGFYDNGSTQGGFVFDPNNPRNPFTLIDTYASAGFNDTVRDALFLAIGSDIREWEAAESRMTYTWKSKEYQTQWRNYAYACVIAESYPVSFTLYADGVAKYTVSVADADAFPLPASYRAQRWNVGLGGTTEVTSLYVANDKETIRRLIKGT